MRCASAVAGDVDRGRGQTCVFERLEHGDAVGRQMLAVHVDDRVEDPPRHPGCTERRERRPVLHDPLLAAVVPDEMRDVVDVRMSAGRKRRETHRRQRGERRDRALVASVLGEERQRRRALVADGRFEDRRRQAVDDDEDHLFSRGQGSAIRHSARGRGRAGARRALGRQSLPDIRRPESTRARPGRPQRRR